MAGAIAQLGERNNGIVEVGGSIPPGSTTVFPLAQSLLAFDNFDADAIGCGKIAKPVIRREFPRFYGKLSAA